MGAFSVFNERAPRAIFAPALGDFSLPAGVGALSDAFFALLRAVVFLPAAEVLLVVFFVAVKVRVSATGTPLGKNQNM